MTTRTQRIFAGLGVAFGVLYLLNPGWGLFELIPDIVPVLGNLDEAGAALLLIQSVRKLREPRK